MNSNLTLIVGIAFEILAAAIIVTSIIIGNDVLGERTDSATSIVMILGIIFIAVSRKPKKP